MSDERRSDNRGGDWTPAKHARIVPCPSCEGKGTVGGVHYDPDGSAALHTCARCAGSGRLMLGPDSPEGMLDRLVVLETTLPARVQALEEALRAVAATIERLSWRDGYGIYVNAAGEERRSATPDYDECALCGGSGEPHGTPDRHTPECPIRAITRLAGGRP